MKLLPNYFVDGTRFKTLMFFGDQLTVERARSAQKARIASDTKEDSLNGLEPAEANFLQVCGLAIITSWWKRKSFANLPISSIYRASIKFCDLYAEMVMVDIKFF